MSFINLILTGLKNFKDQLENKSPLKKASFLKWSFNLDKNKFTALKSESLEYFKNQKTYPKFYFETKENLINLALGNSYIFSSPLDLENILDIDYNLCGNISFEGEINFYLPKLFIKLDQNLIEIYLYFTQKEIISIKNFLLSEISFLGRGFSDNLKLSLKIYENLELNKKEKEKFIKNVNLALGKINSLELQKVVLSSKLYYKVDDNFDRYKFFKRASNLNKNTYHFILERKKDDAFLGMSPETLFKIDKLTLKTEALAGTILPGKEEFLLKDSKNLYENSLVLKDIKDKLEHFSQDISIEDVSIRRLGYVSHLVQLISVLLKKDIKIFDIISSMHPTSAVGGMPFNKVQKFIFSNEGLRSDYASAIGVLSKDKQELCVGLRSCSLKDINLELYVGAGIVKGSSPEDEYIELLNKSQGLLRSLEVVKI